MKFIELTKLDGSKILINVMCLLQIHKETTGGCTVWYSGYYEDAGNGRDRVLENYETICSLLGTLNVPIAKIKNHK